MLIDLLAAIAIAVVLLALIGWTIWDTRTRYGPVIYGNRRWKRETPRREADSARREALAALTVEDRAWLTERGWRP